MQPAHTAQYVLKEISEECVKPPGPLAAAIRYSLLSRQRCAVLGWRKSAAACICCWPAAPQACCCVATQLHRHATLQRDLPAWVCCLTLAVSLFCSVLLHCLAGERLSSLGSHPGAQHHVDGGAQRQHQDLPVEGLSVDADRLDAECFPGCCSFLEWYSCLCLAFVGRWGWLQLQHTPRVVR